MLDVPKTLTPGDLSKFSTPYFLSRDSTIEPVFVEIQGYLLVPEIRQALTAIIGFYFGQATIKT